MPEYTLKISDGYCTWVFELNGSNRLSIQMLLDNAIKDTGLYVAKEYIEGAKNTEQANQPDSKGVDSDKETVF